MIQRRRSSRILMELAADAGRPLSISTQDLLFAAAAERASVQLMRAGDPYWLIRVPF